jgi:hypothetical protein
VSAAPCCASCTVLRAQVAVLREENDRLRLKNRQAACILGDAASLGKRADLLFDTLLERAPEDRPTARVFEIAKKGQ